MPADQGGRLDDERADVLKVKRSAAVVRWAFCSCSWNRASCLRRKTFSAAKRRTTTKESQTESRSVCSYDLQRLRQLAQLLLYAWHSEIFSQLHARFFNTFRIFADHGGRTLPTDCEDYGLEYGDYSPNGEALWSHWTRCAARRNGEHIRVRFGAERHEVGRAKPSGVL